MLTLILFLAVCLGVSGLGAMVTEQSVRTWYPSLRKPPGTPPSWLFGPVWTSLYALMAISAWLIWRQYHWGARPALLIFLAQLALNLAWSVIFFGARRPGFALAEIITLWWAILFNIYIFYSLDIVAAYLLIPYLVWVSFAAYLNAGICLLNRKL